MYINYISLAEITTTVRRIAVEVPLGRPEGLVQQCAANFDNARTVPKSALRQRIGSLSVRRHAEAKRAMGHALGWDELIQAL